MPRPLAWRRSALARPSSSSSRRRYERRRAQSANAGPQARTGCSTAIAPALTSTRVLPGCRLLDERKQRFLPRCGLRQSRRCRRCTPARSARARGPHRRAARSIRASARTRPCIPARACLGTRRLEQMGFSPNRCHPRSIRDPGVRSAANRRTASTSSAFSGVASKFPNRRPLDSTKLQGIAA